MRQKILWQKQKENYRTDREGGRPLFRRENGGIHKDRCDRRNAPESWRLGGQAEVCRSRFPRFTKGIINNSMSQSGLRSATSAAFSPSTLRQSFQTQDFLSHKGPLWAVPAASSCRARHSRGASLPPSLSERTSLRNPGERPAGRRAPHLKARGSKRE